MIVLLKKIIVPNKQPFERFVTKAERPLIKFHVRSVISLDTDSAIFPVGWIEIQLTAFLLK